MVPQIVWAGLVPLCVLAAWLVVRRPVRSIVEDRDFSKARDLFRLQREGLEARFLASLGRLDPIERLRGEDAHWHDDVVWARDRQSRRLLALVGVHFDADPITSFPDEPPRQATALFEFRKGRWNADGRHIDEIRPDEAFLRHREFEPIVPPPHQRA
jgi:hypothetical protein